MKTPFFAVAALALFVQSCGQSQQPAERSVTAAEEVQPPVAVITGAETAPAGQTIRLSYSKSTFHKAKWYVDMSGVIVPGGVDESLRDQAERLKSQGYKVESPSEDSEAYFTCGDMLVLSPYPGSIYRVALAVTNEAGDVDIVGHVVTVAGNPAPPPDDDPPDEPEPPTPPPVAGYGLSAKVPAWIATVPAAARGDAVLIKQVLEANAKLAADGRYRTIIEMQAAIGVGLTAAITDKLAWAGFGASLMGELNKLQTSGKIETPEDFGKAISEVAGAM